MVETKCNKCAEIVDTRYFLCKITIIEKKDFMLPTPDKKQAVQSQIIQREGHLCSGCWRKIEKEFKHII